MATDATSIQELWARRNRQELETLEAYRRHLEARVEATRASEEYDRLKGELLQLDTRLRGKGEQVLGWDPLYGSDARKAEIVARRIQQLRERVD